MSRREEFVGVRVIEIADYDGNGNNQYAMWLNSKEPIVRCRDCKLKFEQGCHEFCSRNHNQDGEAYMVDPDGFCKWGVKRK